MDFINNANIYKYKNLDINKLEVLDFNILYDSNLLLIQGPIFNDYEISNYYNKKYLELKLDDKKISHVKFLTFIDSIEIKLKKYINIENKNTFKTQIITSIQNKKSLKVKLTNDTVLYNNDKNIVKNLYSNRISILFKLEFNKFYYSWVAVQILQL